MVIVHPVEWVVFKIFFVKRFLERETGEFLSFSIVPRRCTYVVLFHNLDETGKIELGEQGQVVHIRHKRCDFIFQLSEPLFSRIDAHPRIALIVVIVTPSIVIAHIMDIALHIPGRSPSVRLDVLIIARIVDILTRFANEPNDFSF